MQDHLILTLLKSFPVTLRHDKDNCSKSHSVAKTGSRAGEIGGRKLRVLDAGSGEEQAAIKDGGTAAIRVTLYVWRSRSPARMSGAEAKV